MSLEKDQIAELVSIVKELGESLKNTLTSIQLLKDEITDSIEDLTKQIQKVESYQKNVLEPNQRILYKKVLKLQGEEEEETEQPTKTDTE